MQHVAVKRFDAFQRLRQITTVADSELSAMKVHLLLTPLLPSGRSADGKEMDGILTAGGVLHRDEV